MATGNVTTTTVDAFIPEIWSQESIFATTNASVFLNNSLVRVDWNDTMVKGDTLHIPKFSAVTVGTKNAGSDVTFTNYTESTKDISIDQHKYFAFKVEDIARVQASPDLVAGYSMQGGAGLAKDIDTYIAALIQNTTVTQNVGNLNTAGTAYGDITDAVIRNGIQLLDEANAPDADRHLVISPEQKNAILGIDKFVLDSSLGDNSRIRTGIIGSIPMYGLTVWVSNNLAVTASSASVSAGSPLQVKRKDCMMFQKEAFGVVIQKQPTVNSWYNPAAIATEVVGDIIYGAADIEPTFAVEVRTTYET